MDWMQWSLTSPPPGSVWPSMPQDFNETLALTTALGYSLFACETCMLNRCFDAVSMSSRQLGYMGLVPVSLYQCSCQKFQSYWQKRRSHDFIDKWLLKDFCCWKRQKRLVLWTFSVNFNCVCLILSSSRLQISAPRVIKRCLVKNLVIWNAFKIQGLGFDILSYTNYQYILHSSCLSRHCGGKADNRLHCFLVAGRLNNTECSTDLCM